MNPVLIINDPPAPVKKERLVEIFKNNVFKDIELYTFKHVDGSGVQDNKVNNAVSADNSEDVDGAIIARNVEFRDAQLRRKLRFALAPKEQESATDEITLVDGKYTYHLLLPELFKDSTLRALAEYMHRFLVFGALYDWYAQFGMQQANVYGAQLKEIEQTISDMLKEPTIAKKPLQPFGPANKMY